MQTYIRVRQICLSAVFLAATSAIVTAADLTPIAPAPSTPYLMPQTMTGDWFGQGKATRDAGFDLRVEWSQFDQGMVQGGGNKAWQYGGKLDALGRFDLSKFGFWNGLSLTAQGNVNYGESVNGFGGSLFAENAALFFPGIKGPDASDMMALYVQQNFGDKVSVLFGKLNLVEFARATPLRGGGGVDTFWNVNLATPITGLSPPTIFGGQVRINTQPVSFSVSVFDAKDATHRTVWDHPFENGVNVMGTATLATNIAGLTGSYGIKGIYSTQTGPDLSSVIPPPGLTGLLTKQGSYYVGFSFQQFLIQDASNPKRGWGVFGEITKADGNPNTLEWSGYFGLGGSSLFPSRSDDRFGVAYFRYGASSALKADLAPVLNLEDQSGVELFYNVAVTPWFRVTADLQFIRPALGDFPRSVYAGVGTYVKF
jgi:porin